MPKVAVIMGSASDFDAVADAVRTIKQFGVDVDVRVISAHRSPDLARDYAMHARDNGFEVIIAAAGKAAHLAGVIAAHTTLPVIGLPVKSSTMDGLDSLLSVVQMPTGVPVATVAINGAANAALLALQILGIKYVDIQNRLCVHKVKMAQDIENAQREIDERAKDVY